MKEPKALTSGTNGATMKRLKLTLKYIWLKGIQQRSHLMEKENAKYRMIWVFQLIFRTCSIYDECHQTFDVTRTSSRPKDTMHILALRNI